MRSLVLCSLLLALAATSAQAGGLKKRTSSLGWSCDVKGIVEDAKDILSDSIALVFDVKDDISAISRGALSCVTKDITKPTALVKCVISEARTEVNDVYTAVQDYLDDLKTAVSSIESKLKQCSQL